MAPQQQADTSNKRSQQTEKGRLLWHSPHRTQTMPYRNRTKVLFFISINTTEMSNNKYNMEFMAALERKQKKTIFRFQKDSDIFFFMCNELLK